MIDSLKDIEDILKPNMNELIEKFNIQLIYVFGSFAKGTNDENSDIDIAILSKEKLDGYVKLSVYGELVDILNNENIYLVILNNVNEVVKFQVIKYGRPIYMEDLYTKVMFESRVMSEYMDKEHFRNTQFKYSHERFLEVMK